MPQRPATALQMLSSLAAFGILASPVFAVPVLDDDFESPSYSIFALNGADRGDGNDDDVSDAFFDPQGSGGNPGGFGLVVHSHDVDRDDQDAPINGDGNTSVQSFLTEQTVTYTPSTQGEIQSVSFSLDVRTSDPFDSVFFYLEASNGAGSVANGSEGFLSITPNGEFQTIRLENVTQDGQDGFDFGGSDPISFGFGFTSPGVDVTDGPVFLNVGVDNFRVTVTPRPRARVTGGAGPERAGAAAAAGPR